MRWLGRLVCSFGRIRQPMSLTHSLSHSVTQSLSRMSCACLSVCHQSQSQIAMANGHRPPTHPSIHPSVMRHQATPNQKQPALGRHPPTSQGCTHRNTKHDNVTPRSEGGTTRNATQRYATLRYESTTAHECEPMGLPRSRRPLQEH